MEMIGRILNVSPLIGEMATKHEVLKRISSVALVHIAAHGKMETGEVILAPNTTRDNPQPQEKDYLLTMKDVIEAGLRARLVVLSCCHTARGEVMAEGVVGMARALLGAGARSVVVTLWAIGDEGTLEFMSFFYDALSKGKKASEALNQAMKCMKEIEKFKEVIYWAPFVLIGDDVNLDFKDISKLKQVDILFTRSIQYKVTLHHNCCLYVSVWLRIYVLLRHVYDDNILFRKPGRSKKADFFQKNPLVHCIVFNVPRNISWQLNYPP